MKQQIARLETDKLVQHSNGELLYKSSLYLPSLLFVSLPFPLPSLSLSLFSVSHKEQVHKLRGDINIKAEQLERLKAELMAEKFQK